MGDKKMVKCVVCRSDIAKGVKKCPNCGKDQRSFFMRHKILTGILAILSIFIIGSALGGGDKTPNTEEANNITGNDKVDKIVEAKDLEEVKKTEILEKSEETEDEAKIPREYKAALKKAETYSKIMHMSKKRNL